MHSKEGTKFRIWATRVLSDHITKGFSYNEHRLKELEKEYESQRDRYNSLRNIVEKFLGKMARKEALDAVIDDIDSLKSDIAKIQDIL